LDDPEVVKASEKFIRAIVRRPHVYEFREKRFRGKNVPIPGIIFLDGEGKLVGAIHPETAKELVAKMTELTLTEGGASKAASSKPLAERIAEINKAHKELQKKFYDDLSTYRKDDKKIQQLNDDFRKATSELADKL
jgi:hypothetical protein